MNFLKRCPCFRGYRVSTLSISILSMRNDLANFSDDISVATPTLTSVQIAIVGGLARGETHVHIAQQVHLSPNTVRYHLTRLSRLLNARNSTHLLALLLCSGALRVEDFSLTTLVP